LPLPIPRKSLDGKPLIGLFHYESETEYGAKITGNPEVMKHVDFTIIPKPSADLPITLICLWGFPWEQYLAPPPPKIFDTPNVHPFPGSDVYVADFRGVIPPGYTKFFKELSTLINIDFFAGPYRNAEAPSPYVLSERIAHMGRYSFVIIAESIIEDDWYVAFTCPSCPSGDSFVT
jgi:hypothetical protein